MTDTPPDPFSDTRRAEETFRLEPAPTWVGRAAIPWETPSAPDDHVVCLLAHTQWAPDHFLRHERSVRRLVSREAVQQLSQIEVEWDPAIETLLIHELCLWRDGVKRSFAERSRFILRQREGSFEQQLVHGRMSAIALLDDVRAGDSVELEFSVLSQARLPGERFDALYASERTITTGRWVVSVILPADSTFQWWRSDPSIEITESHTPDGAGIVRTFSGKQDSPLLIESGIPPWLIPYRHFQVSGYHSWAEVGKCIADAWASVPRDTDALRAFAEELARDAATLEEKACAVIDWVQEHVRYLGMVGGAGGLRPSSPNLVLERRYGDCKDKTLLLCSLLEGLGIAAEPVLVNTTQRHLIGGLLPGLGSFDHVIASFRLDDRLGFADATTAGDGGGAFERCLPAYGLGLPIRPGSDQLIEIPDQSPDRSSLLVTEDIHLDPGDAPSHLDWRIEAVGSDANHLRARLRAVGGDVFAKAEAENLRQTFPTARHLGPAKWTDDKRTNRVIVWGRVAFADWGGNAQNGRKAFQYRPRWIYNALSAPTLAEKRTHPFQLIFPVTVRHEIRIHQHRHGFSQKIRLKSDNPYFRTTTSIRKTTSSLVEADYAYHIRAGILNPDQVEDYWKHLDNAVSNQLGLTLSLRGKSVPNRSLPDPVENLLPSRDETGIETARVDPLTRTNLEHWIDKPAAEARSSSGRLPTWAIVLIVMAVLGIIRTAIQDASRPSSRPAPADAITTLSKSNLAYATWEKHFFAQEPETLPALEALRQVAPGEPRTRYAAAMTAFAEGRTDEAEKELNAFVPDSLDARILRGQIALSRGDLDTARRIADDIMKGAADRPLGWMLGAFVAEASGDLPLAAERITHAVQLDPRNFLIRKTELRLLSGLPDPAPAVAACTRSIADFPDHSLFTEWMADHLAATGRPAEAIAAARRAVKISKSEPRSRIVLARLLAASPDAKDHSESTTLYADLLRESGGTTDALRALAMTALVAGDDRWAIEVLTQASTASPDAATLANLAYALIAAGRLDEARSQLDRALTLDPRSADVRRVFLLLADQTGDTALRARIEQMPEK